MIAANTGQEVLLESLSVLTIVGYACGNAAFHSGTSRVVRLPMDSPNARGSVGRHRSIVFVVVIAPGNSFAGQTRPGSAVGLGILHALYGSSGLLQERLHGARSRALVLGGQVPVGTEGR